MQAPDRATSQPTQAPSNTPCNPNQHVTAVITHRVRSGREAGYEEWIKGIAAAARQFQGHLGVNILRPRSGEASDYVIVLPFNSAANLENWLNSDERNGWIDRVKPLIQEQESVQVLSGLESWFELPSQLKRNAPKRYKQAMLVWVGVVSISIALTPLLAPILAPLPWFLRIAVQAAIVVTLLSYVVMPKLTRWFKGWLFR